MTRKIIGQENEKNRDRWVRSTLRKIPRGWKILDAGAGEQQYKKYCKHLKYFSQDIGQYNGIGDKRGLQTKKWNFGKLDYVSDITNIPVKDGTFDAILCTEVFEHIVDPIKAIKEFSRITKKGGCLILSAPFCSLTHFAPYHYHTGFNKYFYEKALSENGFKIVKIDSNGNYFEYIAQELRRTPFVINNYTLSKSNFIIETLIKFLLAFMQKIDKKDRNSDELLCFGYEILARRV
jgi:ubiquinone/menaquinone biosynthesis C-methylase UbiE